MDRFLPASPFPGPHRTVFEFEKTAKQLIQTEVKNTIPARKDTLGVKLVRAPRKGGKLNERATYGAMIMSMTNIRGIGNNLIM